MLTTGKFALVTETSVTFPLTIGSFKWCAKTNPLLVETSDGCSWNPNQLAESAHAYARAGRARHSHGAHFYLPGVPARADACSAKRRLRMVERASYRSLATGMAASWWLAVKMRLKGIAARNGAPNAHAVRSLLFLARHLSEFIRRQHLAADACVARRKRLFARPANRHAAGKLAGLRRRGTIATSEGTRTLSY